MPGPVATLFQAVVRDTGSSCVDRCLDNWKIGFAAILFVETIIFGHIIYGLKRFTASSAAKFSYVFHLGNALSGGVFFAAGVLHILPEAIALVNGEHGGHGDEDEHEDEHGDEDHEEERRWLSFRQEEEEEDDHGHGEEEDSHSEGFPWAYLILMLSFYGLFFIEKLLLPRILASKALKRTDEESGELAEDPILEKEGSDLHPETKGFKSREFVTGVVEILGISAHSLFESMALGLSGSFSTVLNIFIATVAHRWATASALGFKLLRTLNFLPFLVLLLIFSAIAPIGILIGAALGNLSQTVQGVLFSISAGTFIYIGVYEVMAEEFTEHKKWLWTKFLMTLLGAAILTVVTVILNVLDIHG